MKRPAPNGMYTAATHVGRIRDVTNVVETAALTADFVVVLFVFPCVGHV